MTTAILDLKRFLPYRLSVLEQLISRQIANCYEKEYAISRLQWRVIATLAMFRDLTASDICNFTHMEKMQASRAIKGLVERELLQQQRSEQDHRRVVLNLTDQGFRIYSEIVPRVVEEQERIFNSFTAEEKDTLHQLMHKLCIDLEQISP
jgi:DNA-binding MarR family transcriptional regulator